MAAYSSLIRGAATVYVVDKVPNRLRLAQDFGAIPIDYSRGDPTEQIKDRNGVGTDKGIDAVGYQASVPEGQEQPALVLNNLVETVRPTGRLGVVGLYLTSDPGAPDENAARGRLLFDVGKFFEKGLKMGTGQADVRMYSEFLRDLIIAGQARPSFVVSKELPLADAPGAYERFDRREEGYSKVVLRPGQAA